MTSASPPVTSFSPPDDRARALGVSREAVEIYQQADVLDLHLDSFIWTRIFGYNLRRRHGLGPTRGHFLSQVDFPRVLDGGLTGATWVITTNPLRRRNRRPDVFLENLRRLQGILESRPESFRVVRNAAEYREARADGRHGAFIGIQGGNALDRDARSIDLIPDDLVLRVTLVHLSNSSLGATSAPSWGSGDGRLTPLGIEMVHRLDAKRIFVDLAHIHRKGFFDAVEAHDVSHPLLVTHTGVSSVHKHWRNLDDDQLRAIADTGGTIGVMYQSSFLGDPWWRGRAESVVRHVEHIVETVGEDHASLGSDWDGAISPPTDLKTPIELPRVVELMLRRGWSADRIRKILGGNFLRTVETLRG